MIVTPAVVDAGVGSCQCTLSGVSRGRTIPLRSTKSSRRSEGEYLTVSKLYNQYSSKKVYSSLLKIQPLSPKFDISPKSSLLNKMGSKEENPWRNLPEQLSAAVLKMNNLLAKDAQFQAFANTPEVSPVTFGIKAAGSDNSILITVKNSHGSAISGNYTNALFTLSALPEQWEEFFKPIPKMPYQSYWGMFGKSFKKDCVSKFPPAGHWYFFLVVSH